jgi:dynactin complex subunit
MTQNLATGGTIYDEALEALVKECKKLSHDLLAVLHTLKIDAEKNRRIEAVKKSLKSFRKRREIREVYDRLCKARDQVCSHLNFLVT